ncbi:MAG: hypothetical protein U9R21_05375, partial [Candidatus Thermoplasmatota archaeon]|nr:hypothetical protein [Candidatus Thermoplasmatota archaeon]
FAYVYKIVLDTLIYKMGDTEYKDFFNMKCPNCSLKLVRVYIHKNPKHGKQQWISVGRYCTRCKYVWMDKKPQEATIRTAPHQ